MTLINVDPVPPKPSDLIAPADFIPHWDESVTDDQYHADRTSVGSTQLRMILDSPAAFYESYYGQPVEVDEEEPKHFSQGRMIHMAILEPDRFSRTYVVMPEFWGVTAKGERTNSANSKEVKEKRSAWLYDLPPGAKVCTERELRMLTKIANNIMKHPQGPNLIKDCAPEVAGYYRDPETGIKIRFKPDLLKRDGSALNDLKSTKSTQSRTFGSSAFSLRYDIQLVAYKLGAKAIMGKTPELLTSIAVEKNGACEVGIFYWLEEDIAQGEVDYRAALRKLRQCIDSNKWPARQEMIERIQTPAWFINQATAGV